MNKGDSALVLAQSLQFCKMILEQTSILQIFTCAANEQETVIFEDQRCNTYLLLSINLLAQTILHACNAYLNVSISHEDTIGLFIFHLIVIFYLPY